MKLPLKFLRNTIMQKRYISISCRQLTLEAPSWALASLYTEAR